MSLSHLWFTTVFSNRSTELCTVVIMKCRCSPQHLSPTEEGFSTLQWGAWLLCPGGCPSLLPARPPGWLVAPVARSLYRSPPLPWIDTVPVPACCLHAAPSLPPSPPRAQPEDRWQPTARGRNYLSPYWCAVVVQFVFSTLFFVSFAFCMISPLFFLSLPLIVFPLPMELSF